MAIFGAYSNQPRTPQWDLGFRRDHIFHRCDGTGSCISCLHRRVRTSAVPSRGMRLMKSFHPASRRPHRSGLAHLPRLAAQFADRYAALLGAIFRAVERVVETHKLIAICVVNEPARFRFDQLHQVNPDPAPSVRGPVRRPTYINPRLRLKNRPRPHRSVTASRRVADDAHTAWIRSVLSAHASGAAQA